MVEVWLDVNGVNWSKCRRLCSRAPTISWDIAARFS